MSLQVRLVVNLIKHHRPLARKVRFPWQCQSPPPHAGRSPVCKQLRIYSLPGGGGGGGGVGGIDHNCGQI